MFFAIAARRVRLLATCYLADGASVDALAFWSEAAVPTHLLVVAWAIAGRAGLLITILCLCRHRAFIAQWSGKDVSRRAALLLWKLLVYLNH